MAVSVQHLLAQNGYWAIFLAIFFEDIGIPMPGETLLIAASISASQGKLHSPVLLLFAWAAAVPGDQVGFLVGAIAVPAVLAALIVHRRRSKDNRRG